MKVYMSSHPRAMSDGYVYEHWLVMEKKLGRYLTQKEQVHHINRIKDDNRPENLMLYADRSAHMKESHSQLNATMFKIRGRIDIENKVIAFIEELLSSDESLNKDKE